MKNHAILSSSEISKRCNVSYQTLNYYTNLGLLAVKKRRGNGRLYDYRDVKKRLAAIECLKDKGYPLRLIGKILRKKRGHVL